MNVTYQNGWAVPAGWKMVPEEPTEEMLAATSWPGCAKTDYRHMLRAAPQPAQAQQPVSEADELLAFTDHATQPAQQEPSDAISVVGMPEFDALMDHIYEHGTASEGVLPLANAFARANVDRAVAPLQAEINALRDALKELVIWTPSADVYRRMGFNPEAPMRAFERARALLRRELGNG